ncbi:MAG: response regulator [Burkholderiales bacterium]
MSQKPTYRLTPKGRSALAARASVPVPLDCASILGILDRTSDPLVIRSYLAGYLAHVVDDWLTAFEADGLIERTAAAPALKLPATLTPISAVSDEDMEREVSFADMSLTRIGVYIAQERIARRTPSKKSLGDTIALVVEDDPDQLALARLRLATAGYTVAAADSVQALYRYLERNTPDAIFLDVNLPDGNGFEALAALRQDERYAQLPIIMVTVRSDPQDISKGLALGAEGYVTKPYGKNTLEYVLRSVMKQELPVAAEIRAAA